MEIGFIMMLNNKKKILFLEIYCQFFSFLKYFSGELYYFWKYFSQFVYSGDYFIIKSISFCLKIIISSTTSQTRRYLF